ncbi:MAG: hypothetical protein E3K36_06405 [Candidatus Brocadia sp.]|nr:hypothetical protein [Candidatus Brocadia sp.]
MANPQCEDGYTKIANELFEALIRTDLSGHCFRIALLVPRKTYGFNKKEDLISLSQMAKDTGLSKSRCSQIINVLEDRNIITVSDFCNGLTKKYRFNKDFETWKTVSENCYRIRKVIQKGIRKVIPQKKYIQKKIYTSDSIEVGLSEKLLSLIKQRKSDFKQPNIQSWVKHIDLMIRLDRRSPDEIEKVITWCQADSFWQNNILSTEKLRKQYDALYLKAFNSNGKHTLERQRYF